MVVVFMAGASPGTRPAGASPLRGGPYTIVYPPLTDSVCPVM
jgi:hypothetical protein